MVFNRLFALFESLVRSFLTYKKENTIKKILINKLSDEAKNLPYLIAGIFIFSVIFSLAIFCAVLGTTTFYNSTTDALFFNTWNLSSIFLFLISFMAAIPIILFINKKQKEILQLQSSAKSYQSIFSPLVNEIKKESVMLLNAVGNKSNKTQTL